MIDIDYKIKYSWNNKSNNKLIYRSQYNFKEIGDTIEGFKHEPKQRSNNISYKLFYFHHSNMIKVTIKRASF